MECIGGGDGQPLPMKLKPYGFNLSLFLTDPPWPPLLSLEPWPISTRLLLLSRLQDLDDLLCSDLLCSDPQSREHEPTNGASLFSDGPPSRCLSTWSRAERAWAHWAKLGRPKLKVDNSELPFRMLCRKYDAKAAYTPMLHSKIFTKNEKYRSMEFTTCKFRLA